MKNILDIMVFRPLGHYNPLVKLVKEKVFFNVVLSRSSFNVSTLYSLHSAFFFLTFQNTFLYLFSLLLVAFFSHLLPHCSRRVLPFRPLFKNLNF